MTLPKITQPIFEFDVPSLGEKRRFRAFTVREEKILLIAKQADEQEHIMLSLTQIINNCSIDDDIDATRLPYFDIEYLFIKLRIVSIGGTIDFKVNDNDAKIDLDDVVIQGEVRSGDITIKLDETTAVYMKYPTVKDLATIDGTPESLVTASTRCISRVFHNDNLYNFDDYSDDDKQTFVEDMSSSQFGKFREFFSTLPAVTVNAKYKDKQGKLHDYEVRGLRNFL